MSLGESLWKSVKHRARASMSRSGKSRDQITGKVHMTARAQRKFVKKREESRRKGIPSWECKRESKKRKKLRKKSPNIFSSPSILDAPLYWTVALAKSPNTRKSTPGTRYPATCTVLEVQQAWVPRPTEPVPTMPSKAIPRAPGLMVELDAITAILTATWLSSR